MTRGMTNPCNPLKYVESNGGEGGIRTHEGLAPLPVFKTGAFNRSAISPSLMGLAEIRQLCQ